MTDEPSKLLPYASSADAEISGEAVSAEARSLEADADWRHERVRRLQLTNSLRNKAYHHAVAVCLGLSFYLAVMAFVLLLNEGAGIGDIAQVAIFAAPIAAITLITIFALKGIFQADPEDGSESSLIQTITKNSLDG